MALVDSIVGAESGGDPNARNSRSSASGLGQFLDSTWLATVKQHRPDLSDGRSDADILALKSNPQLSRDMTAAYAADNGAILSRAGLPVTPGTTYLAHFAGPQGAVKLLNSDPNASVGDVLGAAVVNANPFLKDMTAADLKAWADRKMGVPSAASIAPQSHPKQAAPLQIQPPQAAPQFGVPSQPQVSPQQAQPYVPQGSQIEAPPIYAPPRKPIDIAQLRAAFQTPPSWRVF